VLVIGGSAGMGRATAALAAAHGADVVIAGRDEGRLRAAAGAIGPDVGWHVTDVADLGATQALADAVGPVDHVVCTAGVGAPGAIADVDLDRAAACLAGKVWGAIHVARCLGPLIDTRGSLSLFAGGTGWLPAPGVGVTAAANTAVGVLGVALAGELAPRRVNVIAPGVVDTWPAGVPKPPPLARLHAWYATASPAGRVGTPDEVAEAVVATIANPFMSGGVIHVDGGMRAMVSQPE